MKDFNLHFYSNNPANIIINGDNIGLIDNKETFFIDVVSYSDNLIVSCEPISDNNEVLLPYSFRLNYDGKTIYTSNQNVTIVPYPNKNYDIILDFKSMVVSSKSTIVSKKIDNYTIMTMLDSISTMSIYLDDKNIFTSRYAQLSNLEYEKLNNLILIKAKSNTKVMLTVLDTKTNLVILNGTYDKIEKTKECIKALNCGNKALSTGTVYSLNLKTLEIEKYNVYLEHYRAIKEASLIPYALLEAIKDNNFSLAKEYLSDEDSSDEKLKQYFGDIKSIYYNCYHLNKDSINYTILSDNYHNYNFYIKDNKITDIEEISLV